MQYFEHVIQAELALVAGTVVALEPRMVGIKCSFKKWSLCAATVLPPVEQDGTVILDSYSGEDLLNSPLGQFVHLEVE